MILIAVISLGAIGAVGAVFLYAASKKFEVYEDPRIAQVQEVLPGANCGGCGYPGCAGFAGACVKADSLDGLLCPVGGGPVMAKVATILGKEAVRRYPHQPGYGNRRGRRGKMYFLWCLCEGLPEEYHRAKKERT